MKEIISRQLKWQRKMLEEGRCIICGKPAIPTPRGKYCVRCWLNQYIRYASRRKKPVKFKNSKTVRALQLLVNEDWEKRNVEYKTCLPLSICSPAEVKRIMKEGLNARLKAG